MNYFGIKQMASAAMMLIGTTVIAAPAYNFYQLPVPGEGVDVVTGINDSGQVVGYTSERGGPLSGFVGDKDNIEVISADYSQVNGINNAGHFSGAAVFPSSSSFEVFIGDDNGFHVVPTNATSTLRVEDINDSDHILTYSQTSTADGRSSFIFDRDGNELANLDAGFETVAYAINNSDQVTGSAILQDGGDRVGYIWDAESGFTWLDTPGNKALSLDINDNGQVTGSYHGGSGEQAFIGNKDGITAICGDECASSRGNSINNADQIVGHAVFEGQTNLSAFLYDDGNVFDLNDLVAELDGWQKLSVATAINSFGDIAGWGITDNGNKQAFILERVRVAVGEPLIALLFGTGLMGLMLVRRS